MADFKEHTQQKVETWFVSYYFYGNHWHETSFNICNIGELRFTSGYSCEGRIFYVYIFFGGGEVRGGVRPLQTSP